MKVVTGVDTSLTSTGVVTLGSGDPVLHRVRSAGKADDTLAMRRARLDKVAGQVVGAVLQDPPDLVVIEAPAFSSKGGHAHDRSGLWWLVVFALTGRGVPVAEVTPTMRAKYATGAGAGPRASKDAVLTAVVRRYSSVMVSGNDQADALILAAMGRRLLGCPIETSLPQDHLDAMRTLRLPE